MSKYLKYFPKPFLEDLVNGHCLPIIGAGFSKNAQIPNNYKLPDWEHLGKILAKELSPNYQYSSSLDAISAYEHEFSRVKLIERLYQLLLVDQIQPGKAHRAFCEIPFELVVTTNFEFLLEKSYEALNRYCLPIINEDQLSVNSSGTHVRLLKVHGDLHHPSRLVATEEDYDSFIDKNPLLATYLANLLIEKNALFIGYSLDDPDFRQIWQLVKDRLGFLRRPAYSINVSAPSHMISRFERRGVKVINLAGTASEYPEILTSVFQELREYWSNTLITLSTATEDDSIAELSLPKDATSRLCFFSIPHYISSFYKDEVFPIAEYYGFTPFLAIDVLAPGENIMAKVAALIDKAQLIAVDISSPNTIFEFAMIKSKELDNRYILPIIEEGARIPYDYQNYQFLYRPKDIELGKESFLDQISNWFSRASESLQPILLEEPERLLKKKEYKAAVISAITIFENEIKKQLEDIPFKKIPKKATISRILEQAQYTELISSADIKNYVIG